jgi:hypothetical protein
MSGLRWMMALLGLSLSGQVSAAAIGLPENTARFGYAVGISRLAVDDPDGSTKAAVDVQPITLIYTDWLPRGWRYWAEGYYIRATLDASVGDIGQQVSRIGARLAVQRNVQWGKWSPWLGAGLDLSRNHYSKRYTVDSDGFLLNTYTDRSSTAVGITAHIVSEWALARDWDLSTKLEQVFPVNGGITETSLSVGVLYRY